MSKLVDATANRLRLCQVECADLDPEDRRRYLDAAIGEALDTLTLGERRTFLRKLLARFPAWDPPVDPDRSVRAPFDHALLSDPDFLTARLAALIPTLPHDRREAVSRELSRAGLPSTGAPQWPQRPLDDVRHALASRAAAAPAPPETATPDPARALELFALLARLALDLDDVAQMAWNDLTDSAAPVPAAARPPAGLARAIARCLAGDPDAPAAAVAPALASVRRLIGHLIGAVPLVGRLAAAHVRKFGPAEIRAAVSLEPRARPFESADGRCWRKYERLARAFDEDAFAREIRTAVARQVSDWLSRHTEEPQ
jgi:hypothetical protein